MTKAKAIVFCIISFALGMLLQWSTWQMAVLHGKVLRGAEALADERDFWSAIEAKVPYKRNGYLFISHTHEKKVKVARR